MTQHKFFTFRGAAKYLQSRAGLWAIFCALAGASASSAADVPRGVFSLFGAGQKANDLALDNPNVTGITLRQNWAELEPTEGNFDWTFLDGEVARAAAAGKPVLLRINTQSGKPTWVTEAIEAAGGIFFTFEDDGTAVTIPVFWDPTFLARKTAMIRALGSHFSGNSTVAIVAASFANAVSEDWNVPHTAPEILDWLAAGYTSEKLLDAGRQIIDTTMEAFPDQLVTLAIGGNGHVGMGGPNLDLTATYVAANAIATARASWPGRLIVQINSLSTFNPAAPGSDGSPWNVLWNSQPDVAAQMLYWCYDEPTYRVNNGVPGDPAAVLMKSIDSAVSYGTNFIEIYQKDVINLPEVIAYARNRLGPAGLLNVSTRLQVGGDEGVAIGGFIVGGSGTKRVLLRAVGPSLSRGGVVAPLSDPFLELHNATGAIIATNNDWETTELGGIIAVEQQDAIRGTGIAPIDPAEGALIADLSPGAYTAVVRGAAGETGVGLAEIYDLSATAPSIIANLSTRGLVQTGGNALIGGLILGGSEPSNIVVRALGPSLAQQGVEGTLLDPTLDLRDADGVLVASNDDWNDSQPEEIEASGLAPLDTREAAIQRTLVPGSYTATVAGQDGGVGVGLVEIFRID